MKNQFRILVSLANSATTATFGVAGVFYLDLRKPKPDIVYVIIEGILVLAFILIAYALYSLAGEIENTNSES